MRGNILNFDQTAQIAGLEIQCFDLHNAADEQKFLQGERREIPIPGAQENVIVDTMKRTAVGKSVLGTSKAVSIGAWVHALNTLDNI